MDLPLKHICFFLGALSFSFLINSILLRFVRNLGIRNQSEAVIRWSDQVKPALGGLTFYIIFLLSISLHSFIFSYSDDNAIDFQFTGIIGATSLGFLMGLADDAYNTKPVLKLLTQIACGVILIYSGTYIAVFDSNFLNYSITLIWVVGLMNSINMLDNMDGITTIVSIIVAFTIFFLMLHNHEMASLGMTITIGLLAALFGFLYFNWNPSKMYMGDTGSQYLGILLAALGIKYLWNFELSGEEFILSRQLLIPLLSFIIPIIDTTTVVIKRVSNGKSPFIGGKDHTTHHLSYLGLSEKKVAVIIALMSIISSLIVIYIISNIKVWSHIYTIVFASYFILVFVFLFVIAQKNIDQQ